MQYELSIRNKLFPEVEYSPFPGTAIEVEAEINRFAPCKDASWIHFLHKGEVDLEYRLSPYVFQVKEVACAKTCS